MPERKHTHKHKHDNMCYESLTISLVAGETRQSNYNKTDKTKIRSTTPNINPETKQPSAWENKQREGEGVTEIRNRESGPLVTMKCADRRVSVKIWRWNPLPGSYCPRRMTLTNSSAKYGVFVFFLFYFNLRILRFCHCIFESHNSAHLLVSLCNKCLHVVKSRVQ